MPVSESQKQLERNHALLHQERGFRQWMPSSNITTVAPKKAYTFKEASPQIIKKMQQESRFFRKQGVWMILAQLGTALGIIATLWYGIPPVLNWLFPPL